MGMEAIGGVLRRNRLRGFGHVEKKEKKDWVRTCMYMEVEGQGQEGGQERPGWKCLRIGRVDLGRVCEG